MKPETISREEIHRRRHVALHEAFDELLADYMCHHRSIRVLPSNITALALMLWSHQQTLKPEPTEHSRLRLVCDPEVSITQAAADWLRAHPPLGASSNPMVACVDCKVSILDAPLGDPPSVGWHKLDDGWRCGKCWASLMGAMSRLIGGCW